MTSKNEKYQTCIIISAIMLILGIVCIGMGFDKMFNYHNSEYYTSSNRNAYVGGDAYNYIINASYFSGYVSLGGCLLIASTILGVEGMKEKNSEIKKHSI